MSEEEIIKEINIIKETLIDVLEYDLNTYKEDIYNLDTKQVSAIFGLLDLYTKEKEKNKELLYKYKKNGRVLFTPEAIAEKCVSKDKITDKIKEEKELQKRLWQK